MITWSFIYSRDELTSLLEWAGAQVIWQVSKKTDFVLWAGEERSWKVKKAEQLGVPVLTEKDLKDQYGIDITIWDQIETEKIEQQSLFW